MIFPLGFWDISLLLAITAIVLLVTTEMLSQYYGKVNILISRKRLKNAALAISVLFLVIVIVRIVGVVVNP